MGDRLIRLYIDIRKKYDELLEDYNYFNGLKRFFNELEIKIDNSRGDIKNSPGYKEIYDSILKPLQKERDDLREKASKISRTKKETCEMILAILNSILDKEIKQDIDKEIRIKRIKGSFTGEVKTRLRRRKDKFGRLL